MANNEWLDLDSYGWIVVFKETSLSSGSHHQRKFSCQLNPGNWQLVIPSVASFWVCHPSRQFYWKGPYTMPVPWCPCLGQETLVHPLLQSLLGMQCLPGIAILCLGPLHSSQNELSNSPLYFIKVSLEETTGNTLTMLDTKNGALRTPPPKRMGAWEPRWTRTPARGPWDRAQPTSLFQMPLTRNIHRAARSALRSSVWFWSSRLIEIHLQSSHL